MLRKHSRGQGGPQLKIFFDAIFVKGKQSYQMLFTRSKIIDPSQTYHIFKSKNTYNYLAAAHFSQNF